MKLSLAWTVFGIAASGCGAVHVVEDVDAGSDTGDHAPLERGPSPDARELPEVAPPLRPLGAGCAAAAQCGSSVCTAGVCCDKPDDACGSCVGGYVVPKPDGTICANGSCDRGVPTNYRCAAGVCSSAAGVNCCTAYGCAPGTSCPMGNGCDTADPGDGALLHSTACLSFTGRACDAQPPTLTR